ncbi:hypothetical protein BT69DRAFT_1230439 [Atractiella rhizophila]|nr:hypothetical protein BT69DRAFT_1230439 [Atractiella rhizophila]
MLSSRPCNFTLTAPTGIAAVNIGGRTIHSFAGVGLGNKGVGELLDGIKQSRKKTNEWGRCQTLIIDEISMVRP